MISTDSQNGFAVIPIVIAVAVLVVLGGGSAVVYQVQKKNEVEKSALHQEIRELQEGEKEPTPEPQEPAEEVEPLLLPSPTSNPKVKAATTTVSNVVTSNPVSSGPNVPLIVEEGFEKVYGRKPTTSESNSWKSKFRANSWSRSQLYNALIAFKPVPSKVTQPSTTTIIVAPDKTSTTSSTNELSEYLLDKYKREEQERAAQEAALRAQTEARAACLADYNNQLRQLLDELLQKEADINNNPWTSESLRIGLINQAREKYNTELVIIKNRASLTCG